MWIKALLALIAVLPATATATPAAPAPLAPAGPWTVNGDADGACMLTRDYGPPEQRITVGFQPWPNQPMMEVLLLSKTASSAERHGMAYMKVGSGGVSGIGTYTSEKVPGSSQRLTRFSVDRSAFDALPAADSLTLGSDDDVTIAIVNGKGALAALDACQRKLLQAWGIDPATFGPGKPAPIPVGSPANWFSENDYPAAAGKLHLAGRVLMVLTVGEDGLVKSCRAVASAGRILDATTCAIATRRGRFSPAKDAAGKPFTSWAILGVRWTG